MCLKISKTPVVALIVSMYLELLSVRNGICDDQNLGAYASANKVVSNSDQTLKSRHIHSWKGWDDWIPPTTPYRYTQTHKSNVVPLIANPALANRTDKDSKKSSSSVKREQTTKQSKLHVAEEDTSSAIQKSGINLAMSLVRHLISQRTKGSSKSRVGRTVYLDNLGNRQDGANTGMPEGESNRGVIDWLSRLIGVQGKTLGEFLREYQVHVLYDLAFTFFKWIFFLYAGLLIP